MILTDSAILKAMDEGKIIIDPFDKSRLGPNSYDCCIGRNLLVYDSMFVDADTVAVGPYEDSDFKKYAFRHINGKSIWIDPKKEHATNHIVMPDDGYWLMPGIGYLGVTQEYTETYDLVPFIEGKSSMGRMFSKVHITAGRGDIGFCGHWTLEIEVTHPFKMYPGMPVGQLIYFMKHGEVLESYKDRSNSKYGQQGPQKDPMPVASQYYKNFEDGVPLRK